jgi:hypothetical protein
MYEMKKLYLLLPILFLIYWGCEDQTNDNNDENVDEIEFNLEPRLDQDVNGYYHLELNPSSFQTLHRLSGHIYLNDEPLEVMKFQWESSHFWMLGDTLGYIVHQGLTDDLQYVSYDTTYITGFSDFLVPTINSSSYSNSDGEVNTMFAPVWTMRYDTVLVSVGYFDNSYNFINQSIEIVLD